MADKRLIFLINHLQVEENIQLFPIRELWGLFLESQSNAESSSSNRTEITQSPGTHLGSISHRQTQKYLLCSMQSCHQKTKLPVLTFLRLPIKVSPSFFSQNGLKSHHSNVRSSFQICQSVWESTISCVLSLAGHQT